MKIVTLDASQILYIEISYQQCRRHFSAESFVK